MEGFFAHSFSFVMILEACTLATEFQMWNSPRTFSMAAIACNFPSLICFAFSTYVHYNAPMHLPLHDLEHSAVIA